MKKFRLILIAIFLIFLFVNCKSSDKIEIEKNNWNGGYCELDSGRLTYIKTGAKEHYKCEICGKEYIFDKIEKYDSK